MPALKPSTNAYVWMAMLMLVNIAYLERESRGAGVKTHQICYA